MSLGLIQSSFVLTPTSNEIRPPTHPGFPGTFPVSVLNSHTPGFPQSQANLDSGSLCESRFSAQNGAQSADDLEKPNTNRDAESSA